jgi:hypothetical protein
MTTAQQLLDDIEAFMATHGMSPTTFGVNAMGDKAFVFRLRGDHGGKIGDVRASTIDKARAYMRAYRPSPPRKSEAHAVT